jgi:hypothetical protein
VIDGARAFAVRRVDSTVRHLRNIKPKTPPEHRSPNGAGENETTRILQAVVTPTDADEPTERPAPSRAAHRSDMDDTQVLDEIATVLQEIAPLAETPGDEPSRPAPESRRAELPVPRPTAPQAESESEPDRLERLLKFVARQEPGLRWAVGNRADGTTLLVTDLAHGWVPPGIALPAEVRLLEPDRRRGTAAALLGTTSSSATYAPGDALGWAIDYDVTQTSSKARELPAVGDLGWLLSEATHWRDGLPRMVHTLAKAGAAGTGVPDAEIDVLRVHLDTARYQLLAQYPDVDTGLLLNCLLLAATEGIATGNLVDANYHFAWFQMISLPPASEWQR